MIKPGQANVTIYQGAALDLPFNWEAGDPKVAVNLSGYTAHMQIRAKRDAQSQLYFDLTTENGGVVFDVPAGGRVRIHLSMAQTQLITWSTGYGDLILIPPSGSGFRLMEFTFQVSPGTTVPR